MRETIFCGKRCDNGEWVYGYVYKIWDSVYILWGMTNGIPNMVKVIPETVGQYTGLTDKNGQKIFEWDIVKWFSKKYTVVYKEGRFIGEKEQFIGVDEYEFINLYGSLEVVGNVHGRVQ